MSNSTLWSTQMGNLQSQKHMVFFHGWGMHSDVWAPLITFFEKDYRITLIDLPGHGRSLPAAWPEDTDKLLDQLTDHVDQHVVLVGWSLGGLMATLATQKIPNKITALILIACNPCFVQRDGWPDAMPQSTFTQFEEALKTDVEQVLQQFVGLIGKGDEHFREINKQLKKCLFEHGKPSSDALQKGLALLKTTDLRNVLQQLEIPVLHIAGNADVLVPIAITHYLNTLNSNHKMNIVNAAHIPFYSQPDTVADSILHFLRQGDRV